MTNAACLVGGCTGTTLKKKRGWCEFHYGRWRRFGDPTAGGPRKRSPGTMASTCIAPGCAKKARSSDLCSMHYQRLREHGSIDGGKWHQNGRSKEWHVAKSGYVIRFDPMSIHATSGGTVSQHREVMGGILGRRLLPSESVHHKNGDRADNRPSNLELWVKAQPAGQRVEDLVRFAEQVIERYGRVSAKLSEPPPASVIQFRVRSQK